MIENIIKLIENEEFFRDQEGLSKQIVILTDPTVIGTRKEKDLRKYRSDIVVLDVETQELYRITVKNLILKSLTEQELKAFEEFSSTIN